MPFRLLRPCTLAALVVAQALACPVALAQENAELGALTLFQAEGLLARHNREIALARRLLEQAQAGVVIAAQRPNPQLSLAL